MKLLSISVLPILMLALQVSPIAGAGGSSSGHNSAKSEVGTVTDKEFVKNMREGLPLTLDCKVKKEKDEDVVKIKWYKDNREIMPDAHSEHEHFKINENSTLYIAKANITRDVGLYRCETENYVKRQSFDFSVIYLYFKKLPKSITVLQGDKLSIACEVDGTPTPVVTWTKDNINIEDSSLNSSRYHLDANDKHVANATFVIDVAQYEDRATYTCFMTIAGINYSNTTTYVRVKDMYAALWPFLGICVEVFILCLIIFIYEKRRAKAEFDESDTDQPAEQQKNQPEENKDVRHRK